ncbi:nuclear RNA binding protein [Aspergillus ellipticus CBS 707.79]|uniref:Nuclear RNA binding protein n=1 Tax=Aspergillus ellipticus CBS 707.79 TaxID=1448320 RepID=A0A319ED17_9EURO|nr:nuclear RNA binding protein [Aspergillus ellipticus CBS 707.79]
MPSGLVDMDTSMDLDSLDADRELEQSLQSICATHVAHETRSRKHARNISNSSADSEFTSDESGRFDDAEESDYPTAESRSSSVHSTKRRRSTDWPLHKDKGDDDSQAPKADPSGSNPTAGSRRPFHNANGKSAGSPRTVKHARAALRGRRSRFVEGSMNDCVSEKPPSIFLREDARNGANATSQRSSGIFRFGKAIASAFNPFGAWGSRHPPEGASKPAGNPLSQAEKAYAELKKAGYKGTAKGSYLASLNAESNTPQRSWNPIPEHVEHKPVGRHSRQNSGDVTDPGGSIRSSFQELRKAKSSLGIPYMKRQDSSKLLEEVEGPGVRRQKSRKELQRQAKLMKRVSDLELKLERARRELREFVGEDEVLAPTPYVERPYPRKFVPGALPSLPSERLLHPGPASPRSPRAVSAPLASLAENVHLSVENQPGPEPHELASTPHKTTTPNERPRQTSLSTDSPSLKRKSPDPQSLRITPADPNKQAATLSDIAADLAQFNEMTTPRRTKFPKMVTSDSPGSVERKQSRDHGRSPSEERGRRRSQPQPLRSPSTRSPSARRRASNSRNRTQPSLRMKKGRADLRSISITEPPSAPPPPPLHDDNDKENQQTDPAALVDTADEQPSSPAKSNNNNNPPDEPAPSPSPSKKKPARYEYIPPVPPLPKDLSATAAKVDRRLAREMGKKREARNKAKAQTGQKTEIAEDGSSFQWPEDFF